MNAALRQTLSPARHPCGGLQVRIAGEACVLRTSGALWVIGHNTLIAADLHLEKGSAYAAGGQMLPPATGSGWRAITTGWPWVRI